MEGPSKKQRKKTKQEKLLARVAAHRLAAERTVARRLREEKRLHTVNLSASVFRKEMSARIRALGIKPGQSRYSAQAALCSAQRVGAELHFDNSTVLGRGGWYVGVQPLQDWAVRNLPDSAWMSK
jgi:hypothetical protein